MEFTITIRFVSTNTINDHSGQPELMRISIFKLTTTSVLFRKLLILDTYYRWIKCFYSYDEKDINYTDMSLVGLLLSNLCFNSKVPPTPRLHCWSFYWSKEM